MDVNRDDVSGLLVTSANDWFQAFRRLVSLLDGLADAARVIRSRRGPAGLRGETLLAPVQGPYTVFRGQFCISGDASMNQTHLASVHLCALSPIHCSQEYFERYHQALAHLPHDAIAQAISELLRAYEEAKSIFIFGNGGSAALASHFACDLGKGTVTDTDGHKRFRVMALTDNVPLITAWANDSSYERIFAEQLRNFAAPGDVAFAISGSGNSPNVLQALEVARDARATTIGLTGFEGGKMKKLCDVCVVVPSDNMQIIEDFHLSVTHAVFSVIRQWISETALAQPLASGASAG